MKSKEERVDLLDHVDVMLKYEQYPDSTLLDQIEASKFLRLKDHTLEVWRSRKGMKRKLGYVKIGGSVFYELSTLRKFVVDGRVVS